MRNFPPVRTTALKLQRVDINDLALNDMLYYVSDLSYMAVDIGLSSVLFGAYQINHLGCRVLSSQRDDRGPNVPCNPRGDFPHVQSGQAPSTFYMFIHKPLLLCRRKGLSYTAVRVLLPSTLLLYGSTALYMGALASHVTSVARLTAQARAGLLSRAYTDAYFQEFQSDVLKQSWMMTTALIVNVSPGS